MEKVCVIPADDDMMLRVDALNILNEFKKLGFEKRSQFVNVVVQASPEYSNYKKVQELWAFWQTRVFSRELNDKLAKIVEQLKSE